MSLRTGLVSGGAAEAGVGLLQGRHSEASARDDAFPADALEVQGDDVCQRLLQHLLRQSKDSREASDKLQSLYSQLCHLFIRREYDDEMLLPGCSILYRPVHGSGFQRPAGT